MVVIQKIYKFFVQGMKKYPSIFLVGSIEFVLKLALLIPAFFLIKLNYYTLALFSLLVAYIFIIMPLKSRFTHMMIKVVSETNKNTLMPYFCLENYFKSIGIQIKQLFFQFIWGIPLCIFCAIFAYFYKGGMDFLKFTHWIKNIGKYFYGKNATIIEGSFVILCAFGILTLIFIFGVIKNSYISYACHLNSSTKVLFKKKRIYQIMVSIINTILLMPLIYIIIFYFFQEYYQLQNILMFISRILSKNFYSSLILYLGIWYFITFPIRKVLTTSLVVACKQ